MNSTREDGTPVRMKKLPPVCLLLVVCLLILGACCFGQLPTSSRSVIAFIDSLNTLQAGHPRSLATPAPGFPQRQVVVNKKTSNSTKRTMGQLNPAQRTATVCFDTAGRYFMSIDSLHFYVTNTSNCSDGNILICGETSLNRPPYTDRGYLMKCNDTGKIIWTQLYDSTGHKSFNYINYQQMLELSDGSILLAGRTNNDLSGNQDLMITHVDNTGNLIWSKTYTSGVWQGFNGSGDYFRLMQMKQDPASGDVYFCGAHWQNGKNVTRLSPADGTVKWSRIYNVYYADQPFGLDIRQNDLVVFSKYSNYNNETITLIFRINKNTGDTIATRFLKTVDTTRYHSAKAFLATEDLVKLDNGNYAISGKLLKYSLYNEPPMPLYHAGVVEIDQQFNYVTGYCIRNNTQSNYYNTRITVHPDGSGMFSMLEYISSYDANVYYVQFKNGQLLKQRIRAYRNEGMPSENNALQRGPGNEAIIKLIGVANTSQSKIEVLNLHLSDTSSACLGMDDNSNFTEPLELIPISGAAESILPNDFSESKNKTLGSQHIDPVHTPGCRQLSFCDTISLVTTADTVCYTSPIAVTVRKSAACGASAFFNFDTTQVQLVARLNDSAYLFSFKKPGKMLISGNIMGCTVLSDTVKVVALIAPGRVNIGPDTSLCTGNTIRLNAHQGYKSYLWQNTYTDSFLVVSQPGTYFVAATDSCGNISSDTVLVTARQLPAFDLGADINICEKDTVTITAPASFTGYTWFPNYQISNLLQQSVKVYPLKDTMYHVKATVTPGCFVEDSVKVFVKHAPLINLGADSSFCQGDSLLLDAGTGFANYSWNTGQQQQTLLVHVAGTYAVTAKTSDGCLAKDTLRILQVFNNPVVQLGNDSVVCTGTARLLDAGNFASFAWNTGSVQRIITVSQPGVYAVSVTDLNHCKGADTIVINTSIRPPSAFLPADTSFCSYGKLVLKPSGTYSSYLWSNHAISADITVSAPGLYWLEVKDQYSCTGRDTIMLANKDCMLGFYIPNAFSPGHDGKNDIFRPLIFGNLLKYSFTVYNRFGQIVFSSTQLRQGWDGNTSTSTSNPSSDAYVWICTYQLENEPAKTVKGTVLLLR